MVIDLSVQTILTSVIVGGVAGWLANMIFSGKNGSLLSNIIIGIIGGVLGNQLFTILKISIMSGLPALIISATIGAIVLIFLLKLIRK